MSEKFPLPAKWLVLDLLGGLLLAIGLVLLIAEPQQFLPWDTDYHEMGIGLIIVGIMFMLPLLAHLVRLFGAFADQRRSQAPPSGP